MITHGKSSSDLQLRWGDRFASAKDVSWHTHDETELVAVTRGRCRIKVGTQQLEGTRGSIFVLPANWAQYQVTLGLTHTTYLGFTLPPDLFDESARVVHFPPSDPAMRWIEELCDSPRARPPLSPTVTRILLLAVLRRMDDLEEAAGSQARLHPAVLRARRYIETNLAQPLTLTAIAQASGISTSHLSALFAAQCGMGPLRYLQSLRLERACWLLANPYLRIHEVATAAGYEDENYFTRLFRKRFGISPGRWRAQKKRPRDSAARSRRSS